jgi:hypothetical protein
MQNQSGPSPPPPWMPRQHICPQRPSRQARSCLRIITAVISLTAHRHLLELCGVVQLPKPASSIPIVVNAGCPDLGNTLSVTCACLCSQQFGPPLLHHHTFQGYTNHILKHWLDRQVYWTAQLWIPGTFPRPLSIFPSLLTGSTQQRSAFKSCIRRRRAPGNEQPCRDHCPVPKSNCQQPQRVSIGFAPAAR